ncbi:NDK7 kinase, partial [Polyodon spathula]|nr:NDK7 kinase [Polyodon spathula]
MHLFSQCFFQSQDERFAFLAEWYDPNAALLRQYQFLFYPKDRSVEMFDMKNHCTFLRRTKYDDIKLQNLFVGNRLNVFSRQLHLIDYGDQYTASKLGSSKENYENLIYLMWCSLLIDFLTCLSQIWLTCFSIFIYTPGKGLAETNNVNCKLYLLMFQLGLHFQLIRQSNSSIGVPHPCSNLVQFLSSGPVVAMEILGDEAVTAWRRLLGPTDSSVARNEAPDSVRANFGTDGTKNAGHGSDSLASAARVSVLLGKLHDFFY